MDTIIFPHESQWFEDMETPDQIISFNQTQIYKEDLLGLQELDKAGKIYFKSINNRH